jgi:uncharacterized damage-inducible protein DinB
MRFVSCLLALAVAAPLAAQTQQSVPAANAATSAVKGNWSMAHNYVLRSAEQMPESLYSFRPVEGVRSFGELIGHVAGAEQMFCAIALGEQPPAEDAVEKSAKTKADLVAALKASGTFCERAYAQNDAATHAPINMFGMDVTRMFALVMNATHDMEHYGNLVTYFRIKGMVPPSSQR